nr:MAG TPA: hypothetical protein [Caudoviricetes sp.]
MLVELTGNMNLRGMTLETVYAISPTFCFMVLKAELKVTFMLR